MRNRRNIEGFTLVELLAVITILTILSTIALPRYGDYLNRTKLVSFQLQNQKLSHQYHAFVIERGCYPENISNCATDVYNRGILNTTLRAREKFDALVFFHCSLAQDNPPSLFWDAFGHSVFVSILRCFVVKRSKLINTGVG